MIHITALDLEQWAERTTAASELPRLISRLIWAATENLVRLDMPGGELTRLSGFDGLAECLARNDMVPEGVSAWELSAEKGIATKARADYTKRSDDPLGLAMATTTFVFVTPRRWAQAENWATAKRAENKWRDVRVLWSQHLEQWLARVPWIASEFGQRIRNAPLRGIESLNMTWLDYANVALISGGKLDPEFVIAERTHPGQVFLRWLTADVPDSERVIRICGPSEREILHYLTATIRSLPTADCERYESHIFSVSDKHVAQSLGRLEDRHVVLVHPGEALPHVLETRKRCGCRVAIIHQKGDRDMLGPPEGPKCLELEPMTHNALIRSLVSIGYLPERASEICTECNYDYEQVRRTAFLY